MSQDITYRFEFAYADEFRTGGGGRLHCKTVPYYIFAQTEKGHYELTAGDRSVVCEEGGAFFVPPNIPLAIRHYENPETGDLKIRYLHFVLTDHCGVDPFAERAIPLVVSAEEAAVPGAWIGRLLAGELARFRREALLMECAAALYALTGTEPETEMPERFRQLFRWIGQNARQPITVRDMMADFRCSRSKFYTDFLFYARISPAGYIQRERIRYAAQLLLRREELSIKEISALCGWKTPYHFSRVFKSELGEAPGTYRLRSRKY